MCHPPITLVDGRIRKVGKDGYQDEWVLFRQLEGSPTEEALLLLKTCHRRSAARVLLQTVRTLSQIPISLQ